MTRSLCSGVSENAGAMGKAREEVEVVLWVILNVFVLLNFDLHLQQMTCVAVLIV